MLKNIWQIASIAFAGKK